MVTKLNGIRITFITTNFDTMLAIVRDKTALSQNWSGPTLAVRIARENKYKH